MKVVISLLLAACLVACSTPSELKANNPEPASFKVKAGYQTVLKRIVEQHRECDSSPLLPIGQVINDVQNYPDLRSATIVRGSSGIGTQTGQVIEIAETVPGESDVKVYQRSGIPRARALYERWANGGTGCD